MQNKTESVIVSIDIRNGQTVMIVGQRKNGVTNIINAFQNEEAIELYDKLTTQKRDD